MKNTFVATLMLLLTLSFASLSLVSAADNNFVLTFITPTEDQVFNQTFFTAAVTSSETISAMDINLDGSAYYHACDNCNAFTVPVDRLGEGQHNLNLIGTWETFRKNITINFSVDTTAPTVTATTPANSATNVATNANILASFSEAMNSSTITTSTFTLRQGTTNIPGSVSYSGQVATFNPTNDLTEGAVYTATISTRASDMAGNGIVSNYTWSFTAVGATVPVGGPHPNFILAFTTPTEDQVFNQTFFTAVITSNETIDMMRINLDGSAYIVGCTNCNGFSVPVDRLTDGPHNLNLIGTWGVFSKNITVNFSVDTTTPPAPVILENYRINSPTAGAIYNDSVRINISTGNANVVNYSINNGAFVSYTGPATVSLANGTHTLIVRASTSGSFNQTSVTFGIVNTTVVAPVQNQTNQSNQTSNQTNQTLPVSLVGYSINNPRAGMSYNDSVVINISAGNATNINYSLDNAAFVSYTGPVTRSLAEGSHTLIVRASNSQTFNQTSVTFNIVNTTVMPVQNQTNQTGQQNQTNQTQTVTLTGFAINNPRNGFTYEDQVRINISTGNANVVNYSINNGAFTEYTGVTTVPLANGTYTLTVRASTSGTFNQSSVTFHIINTTNVTQPAPINQTNQTNQSNQTVNSAAVVLIDPVNGHSITSATSTPVGFSFRLENTDSASVCNLRVNGNVVGTINITNQTATYTRSVSFGTGSYTWIVECTEDQTQINSSTRSFTIVAPQQPSNTNNNNGNSGSGGGSGGSSSSASSNSFLVNINTSQAGYTKGLGKLQRIEFLLPGQPTVKHSITLDSFNSTTANLTIRNPARKIQLRVGESTQVDMNSDNAYDLYIKLDSIAGNKATVTIRTMNVTFQTQAIIQTPNNNSANNAQQQIVTLGNPITGNVAVDMEALANDSNKTEKPKTGIKQFPGKVWNGIERLFSKLFGIFTRD